MALPGLVALVGGFLSALFSAAGSAAGARLIASLWPEPGSSTAKQAAATYIRDPSVGNQLRAQAPMYQEFQVPRIEGRARELLASEAPDVSKSLPALTNLLQTDLSATEDLAEGRIAFGQWLKPTPVFHPTAEYRRFKETGRCPVSGEWDFPQQWFTEAGGSAELPLSTVYMGRDAPAWAVCAAGHRWRAFRLAVTLKF